MSYTLDGITTSGSSPSSITVSSFETLTINGGTTAYNVVIESGGRLTIGSGAAAAGALVESGAYVLIETGGYDAGLYVEPGAIRFDETVSAGMTVADEVVNVYDSQTVFGTTRYTVVNGGAQVVSSGGTAVGTVFSNTGSQVISSGGTASSTKVSNGGVLYVFDGGTALDTTISSGGFASVDGSTVSNSLPGLPSISTVAISTMVGSGGTFDVLDGGTAENTTISAGGVAFVSGFLRVSGYPGLSALPASPPSLISGATIQSGGYLIVGRDAQITGVDLQSGGDIIHEFVSAGQFVNDEVVGAFDTFQVVEGQTSNIALDDTYQIVSSGGIASGTIIGSGSEQLLYSDSLAADTTVSGGRLSVYGGITEGTILDSGDDILWSSGSLASNTTIRNGGGLELDAGSALNTIVSSGGDFAVFYSTASAKFTTVSNGGGFSVFSGGSVTSTTISNGASFGLFSATADATTIENGGSFTVLSATITNTTVNRGGSVSIFYFKSNVDGLVLDGGQALVTEDAAVSHTSIMDGGKQMLFAGSSLFTTLTGSGSTELVSYSGLTDFTQIGSGSTEIVNMSGVTSNAAIDDGGYEVVSAAGSAVATTISSGGFQLVSSGGTATDTKITAGGEQIVSSGGSATGAIVSNGGFETVSSGGTAEETTVLSGGTQTLEAGALASGTVISSGGFEIVSSGGTASNTEITGSGTQIILDGGLAIGTAVDPGGFEIVSSGGVTSETIVSSGGIESVSSGGAADDTTVLSGGTLVLDIGAITSGTVISDGGFEIVSSGAIVYQTTVLSGGMLILKPGAIASGTVSSGGTVTSVGVEVLSGNTVISTASVTLSGAVVSHGAQEIVFSGGNAVSSLIAFGGTLSIYGGGVASATTLFEADETIFAGGRDSGTSVTSGVQIISSGGAASGTVVNDGGVELIYSGGAASGTTVSSGGTEVISAGGLASFTLIPAGGSIDATYLAYSSAGTAILDPITDLLTVTENGATYAQQLAGNYNALYFTLAQDPGTGTLITAASAPCYCPGTLIMTERGERPIEALEILDLIATHGGEYRAIRWVGRRSYAGVFIADQHLMLPVCIKAHALAPGRPHRDLWVSPGHALFIDGQLIPAWRLINGVSVVQPEAAEAVTYIHLELDRHEVIFANGQPAESYLDDNCRGQFHNAAEFDQLYPHHPVVTPLQSRLEDGFALQLVQQRIAARAGVFAPIEPAGALRGFVDLATPERVCGWAQDADSPEEPVALEIVVNGTPVLCLLANAYRADLREAGFGSGCHAFDMVVPEGRNGLIEVRRVTDGSALARTVAAEASDVQQAA